jgi:hypothetical protein
MSGGAKRSGDICRQTQQPTINAIQKSGCSAEQPLFPFRPARLPFCLEKHKVCRKNDSFFTIQLTLITNYQLQITFFFRSPFPRLSTPQLCARHFGRLRDKAKKDNQTNNS